MKEFIANYKLRADLTNILKKFNSHAVLDGTPPWENYAEAFTANDRGLAIRIEEGLAIQTANIELFIAAIAGILALLIIVFGIAILWNQRKIKRMLRQMQEQNRKDDNPRN